MVQHAPVLVIHGGTGFRVSERRLQQMRRVLSALCARAYGYLQTHSALDAVTYAVQLLEDQPLFNAGTGSTLQRDGRIRMSASVMDGASQRFAAVLNIERVRNPVLVAKCLLPEPDRILAGPEATRFARAHGFHPWQPLTPLSRRRWEERMRETSDRGTVGAVALDGTGHLAAATSTGGKGFEHPGRVSDSGLPVGNYANAHAAVSCTGVGEDIVDEALAARIIQRVSDGQRLARAFARTFRELKEHRRLAGAIGLDRVGQTIWKTTLPVLVAVAQTRARQVRSF